MAAHRLLLLDSSCLSAHRPDASGPVEEARFPPDAAGIAAFREYLGRNARGVFCLVADVADEAFHVEDIPFVHGEDHREIVRRKLAQHFRGSPLTMAISRGRLKEGRRDERLLLVGLTKPAQFEPWLSALREAGCRLEGVFSLPQLVAGLVAPGTQLAPKSAPATRNATELVISIGRAGIRQTFFEEGQLRLSRLTPLAGDGSEDIAATSAVEIGKMAQYLAAQRLIDRDAPLRTLVLVPPGQIEAFQTHCRDTAEVRVELVDIVALGKSLGMALPPRDCHADNLFLHLLARHRPAQQFAPDANRRSFKIGRLRSAIHAGAAAILLACLFLAGERMLAWQGLRADSEALRSDIDLASRRHRSLLDALPKTPLSTEELRALTDRHASLLRRGEALLPSLGLVSRALDHAPAIELTRLDWRLVNEYRDEAADGKPAGDSRPTVPAVGDHGHLVIDMEARLPVAMTNDHRAQLRIVDDLAAALSSRDVQVRVLALPFETESGKVLRSSDTNMSPVAPRFSLRLVSHP